MSIPPMPPMPPMPPGMPPPPAASSFGASAIIASVVSISEATDAGASLEHVRHAATHSDISTTQGYSRDGEVKTAEVLKLRVAYRTKKT